MKRFDVSVIVPFYNAAPFIEKCAYSLFTQTLKNIQFIFVNDKSSDDSLIRLNNVIDQYPHLRENILIINHEQNRGSAAARNTGLDNSLGKYIGWVDADDWVEKDMFEKMLSTVRNNKVEMVWCDYVTHRLNYRKETSNTVIETPKAFIRTLLSNTLESMLWNKLFLRKIINDNDLKFCEGMDLGEDRAFLVQYLYYCKSIKHIQTCFYHYVQMNPDSIVKDGDLSRVYEEIANTDIIIGFLNKYMSGFVSDEEMRELKFNSKKRLLYSFKIGDLEKWTRIFPEVNLLAFNNSKVGFRHKVLIVMLILKLEMPVRLWLYLKKRFGTNKFSLK